MYMKKDDLGLVISTEPFDGCVEVEKEEADKAQRDMHIESERDTSEKIANAIAVKNSAIQEAMDEMESATTVQALKAAQVKLAGLQRPKISFSSSHVD